MNEPLINIRPQSDFEKLLWERSINKELTKQVSNLKFKIGQLKSEIDELKYLLNKDDKYYEVLKIAHHKLQLRIRDLRKTNKELVCKIVLNK